MPTRIYVVTDTPVDLLAANDVDGQPLDLQIGKRYTGRFTALGPQSILKVLEVVQGTAVVAATPALPIQIFEDVVIIPATGQNIFVWSEDGGQLVINDLP